MTRHTELEKPEIEPQRLLILRKEGTKAPLFLFPGGGGAPWIFRHLVAALGNQQPVFLVPARGYDGNQRPHTNLEQRARESCALIKSVQPTGRYHLLGHCFGALLAFETARQLQGAGGEVGCIVGIEPFAPPRQSIAGNTLPESEQPSRRSPRRRLWSKILALRDPRRVVEAVRGRLRMSRHVLRKLSCDGLHALGVTIPTSWREFDILYADRQAQLGHRWTPSPLCMHLLFGRDDPKWAWRKEVGPVLDADRESAIWKLVALGGVHSHGLEGGHNTILEPPHVEAIAAYCSPLISEPPSSLARKSSVTTP